MIPDRKLAAVEERITKLESAYSSLKGQVAQAIEPEQKEKWEEAVDSIEEELRSLRSLVEATSRKRGGEQKSFLRKLLGHLEDAEKVVFRAFVLGTTIIGAGTLLSHEIAPLHNFMMATDQQVQAQRHEAIKDVAGKENLSLIGGDEPVPESLRKQNQDALSFIPHDWVNFSSEGSQALLYWGLDKISEPDSIRNFVKAVQDSSKEPSFRGELRTTVVLPHDVRKS